MLRASDIQQNAAIYVHWPFCEKKCPYCDFNSHVRETVDHRHWQRALITEIDSFAALFPNLAASSIFFGGGTPSLMEPETVALVIDRIRHHWGTTDIEITMEANPSSVEAGRFKAYRAAGVNRLSLGIQSLRDDALQFLGRLHDVKAALAALEVARSTFDRVSFDLIYARPNMSIADWSSELEEALAFEPSHVSLYQLTIEEGTAFYQQYHRGKFQLPDEDTAAGLFDVTQAITLDAGLPAYEISNHARPGQESRHNLAYWQGDYYLGIGPGAHGRAPSMATAIDRGAAQAHQQIKRPENWLEAIDKHGIGCLEASRVETLDRGQEAVMMGLRLMAGINKSDFKHRFGKSVDHWLDTSEAAGLKESGHLSDDPDCLRLTAKGLPLLNYLLPRLLQG